MAGANPFIKQYLMTAGPTPIPPRVLAPQQPVPPFQGPPVNPLVPGRRLSPSLGNRLPLPSASEGVQQPPQPQQ